MLTVVCAKCHERALYAECQFAVNHYVERCYVECDGANETLRVANFFLLQPSANLILFVEPKDKGTYSIIRT
jgi:hypothetical protein